MANRPGIWRPNVGIFGPCFRRSVRVVGQLLGGIHWASSMWSGQRMLQPHPMQRVVYGVWFVGEMSQVTQNPCCWSQMQGGSSFDRRRCRTSQAPPKSFCICTSVLLCSGCVCPRFKDFSSGQGGNSRHITTPARHYTPGVSACRW